MRFQFSMTLDRRESEANLLSFSNLSYLSLFFSMIPPLSFTNVTPNADSTEHYLSSPLPLSPSSPTVPFPSSSMSPPSSLRTRPPIRSPRTSQDSTSKRLSIASTASTSSSLGPHLLMRSRHSSLPASVVQSRHQSIVGTPRNLSASSGVKALNRISVASVGSFGSVEEEEEEEGEVVREDKGSKVQRERLSPAPSRSTSFSKSLQPRPRHASRHSLPSLGGGLPASISSVLNPTGARDRSSSPLRPGGRKEYSMEERARRHEKRMRIAEELRDTEKAYVKVLEEIDEVRFRFSSSHPCGRSRADGLF